MSKLINRPDEILREMLEGFARAYEHDVVLTEDLLVARRDPKAAGRVGLVIGNGSGHEPAMIGWVGRGLFDVNVPGEIFACARSRSDPEGHQARRPGRGGAVARQQPRRRHP